MPETESRDRPAAAGRGRSEDGVDRPARLEHERVGPLPIWGWALASSLAIWLLYLVTLAPTTGFWDASEYIATAHILGIPHPPGNPFFVIVGRTWDVLLSWTGLSVAQRINLLSATASAAGAGFWFLTIVRIWNHWTDDRRILVLVAFLGVLVGGTAFTVWSQSNINEKVYTLSLFFVAVITYLAMRWEDLSGTIRGDRIVLVVAFLLGVGSTNHLMSLLPLGALGALVLWHDWKTLLRPRLMGAAVLLGIVGFSLQLFFPPIRSAQNPIIDEGNPECEQLVDVVPTAFDVLPVVGRAVPDDASCEDLKEVILREQYSKPPLTDRQAPFHAQLANYWQYFDWQWARSLGQTPRSVVTMVFLFLGLVGLARHWTGDRDSFVYMGTFLFTVTLLLVFYLNFKYGYSIYPDVPSPQHEVRERDYFFIASFNLWGMYAAMGLVTLWQQAASALGATGEGLGRGGGGARWRAAPILAVGLLPLLLNFSRADRSGDYSARDWAYNMLQSVEPYGVLYTNGDNDTFPLWYLQEVEGIRRDVIVVVQSYLGTEWYPSQIRDLSRPCPEGVDPLATPTVIVCQRPFEEDRAVAPYEDMDPEKPSRAITDLTQQQIQDLPLGRRIQDSLWVQWSDRIETPVAPGTALYRQDFLVYLIGRHSLGDRPVYFGSTAAPVFAKWNISPYLIRQGLAHKTVSGLLEETVDTVRLSRQFNVRWLDLDRTSTLLWDVFQVEYLLDWPRWPEPSTQASIPTQYYLAYMALAEGLSMRGDTARAERSYRRASELLELSDLRFDEEGQQ